MTTVNEMNLWIDAHQEELFSLLGNLIRINSESFGKTGNEEPCARAVAALCEKLGMETDLYSPLDVPGYAQHPDYLDGRSLERRFNMTARWKGREDCDHLMLMGHTDTVPIGNPDNWTFDPLSGAVHDGCVWGRGACDDKYALATALFVIRGLMEHGFQPKKNLLFTAYSDEEEGGSNGALSACLRYPVDRIVNMDCKNFEIWHCASGGQSTRYLFHTRKPADSAAKIARAMPLVLDEIDAFGQRRREELAANRFYAGTVIPDTSLRYMEVRAGNEGTDLGNGIVKFTFYTDKSKEEIYAELEEVDRRIRAKLDPLGIEGDGFVPATRFFHYTYAEPDCENIRDMCAAALEASGRELKVVGSCLSDLSVINKYGSREAYGFGIGRDFNVYGGAHQCDEFVECSELVEYAKIISAYILRVMS